MGLGEVLIVVSLVVAIFATGWLNYKERQTLINLIVSKDRNDFFDLQNNNKIQKIENSKVLTDEAEAEIEEFRK